MWLLLSGSNRYTGIITVFMGYVRCSWKYYGFPYRFLGFTTTSTLDIGFSLRYGGMIFAVRVISIGREQTARLMTLAGLRGRMKGKSPITTRKASREDTRPDLVKRDFRGPAPNRLWAADITYVRIVKGFVYAAFVTDVFSRKIVGWELSDSMRTKSLPLHALNHAVVSAKETAGLIHYSDRGSQYVSIVYNDTLTNAGIRSSTGTIGDSYDNALAENINGSYKNELILTRR